MGNLKIISDLRIRSIFSKGPKYRLASQIDFNKYREEIAIIVAFHVFCNRWCRKISFYSNYPLKLNFLSDICSFRAGYPTILGEVCLGSS